ncbi:MAG: hypothetical protein ACO1OC_07470 [Tuberibacillus sp.]
MIAFATLIVMIIRKK